MSFGMGGGRRSALSGASSDYEVQREQNAQTPEIPHLRRCIAALFRPYKRELSVTIILVLFTARLTVALSLITRAIFR